MKIKEGKNEQGIIVFNPEITHDHTDYHSTYLDTMYAIEKQHFWFIARKNFILKTFLKFIAKDNSILEIGCGTGSISQALMENGYINISVNDIHINGLQYAKAFGLKNLYQFNLFDAPFVKEFDVIAMFDVLEHLENDVEALQCAHKMLKNKGKVVLTVPAHMWLWSQDDARGHKRRYTLKTLHVALTKANFKITYNRYFFISIMPLLLLRRFMHPDNGQPLEDINPDKININPIINKILLSICALENKLLNFLPNLMGGSIIVVAEKQ
jgi:2-polyprenyl-3-methyl-5-hydroxy-6-metoxy-1,4-benzoquinol methylase